MSTGENKTTLKQKKARHDNLHKTLRTRQDRTRQKPRLNQKARQDNLHKTFWTRQDRTRYRRRQDMTTYTRHLGQDKTEQDRSPGSARIRQDKTTYTRH